MNKAMVAALCAVLGACAHGAGGGDAGGSVAAEALDAAEFARLGAGDRLVAGGERVMALRTTVARVFGRIDGLRTAVRERDAAADWGQLVCLEGQVPAVRVFAGRGERAWDAFRDAVLRGEGEAAWTRFELMRLARLGVAKALATARGCGATQVSVAVTAREVRVESVAVVEPGASPPLGDRTRRVVTQTPELPTPFATWPH